MTFNATSYGIEARPLLPPIHTLDLPFISRLNFINVKYEDNDNVNISPYYHGRRFSTSSSCTNNSRNTSPSPSLDSDSDSTPTEAWGSSTKLRLEPCPLEEANAVIFVPPEAHPLHPQTNWFSHQTKGKGLFLVGPALLQVRHSQRPLAKGARLHPYKIVHGSRTKSSTSSRRSSIISVTGLNL